MPRNCEAKGLVQIVHPCHIRGAIANHQVGLPPERLENLRGGLVGRNVPLHAHDPIAERSHFLRKGRQWTECNCCVVTSNGISNQCEDKTRHENILKSAATPNSSVLEKTLF